MRPNELGLQHSRNERVAEKTRICPPNLPQAVGDAETASQMQSYKSGAAVLVEESDSCPGFGIECSVRAAQERSICEVALATDGSRAPMLVIWRTAPIRYFKK